MLIQAVLDRIYVFAGKIFLTHQFQFRIKFKRYKSCKTRNYANTKLGESFKSNRAKTCER